MDKETFLQKLGALLQKSRKAQRLYSNMGRTSSEVSPYSESQIEEWRTISAEIVRQLTSVVNRLNSRNLVAEVISVRDSFYHLWRNSEAALHKAQRELIASSEKGDFIRAVSLAEEAVVLKARVQASHAAYHEFSELLRSSRINQAPLASENEGVLPFEGDYQLDEISALDKVLERKEARERFLRHNERGDYSQEENTPMLAKVIPLRRA